MNEINLGYLIQRGLPARLDSGQTAKLLGFAEHDIPTLTACGLLKPLGEPAPNAPKYFCALEVLELAADRAWLNRATRAVAKYWKKKRDRRDGCAGNESQSPRSVDGADSSIEAQD